MAKNSTGLKGFTLIELAVSVTILSLIAAGALKVLGRSQELDKIKLTEERQEYILLAIDRYVQQHTHIPCPASISGAIDSANFGIGVDSGDPDSTDRCTGATQTDSTKLIYAGAVPTASLNIHPRYMFDGWNRRFTYAIDGEFRMRKARADANVGPYTNGLLDNRTTVTSGNYDNEPAIFIMNSTTATSYTNTRSAVAADPVGVIKCDNSTSTIALGDCLRVASVFTVISHGKNGYGAYRYNGSGPITSIPGNSGTQEANQYIDGTTNKFDSVRNLQQNRLSGTSYFDDIVFSRTKWELLNIP